MKNLIAFISLVFLFNSFTYSDIPVKKFTTEEIRNLSGSYLDGRLTFQNPVFVDVDKDGDFDALNFDDGNVEYYKNVGTLEKPTFLLENKNYDKYNPAFFISVKMPYPMFFADKDGDGDMDMFVIKDKVFDKKENRFNYKVASAENMMDLDTGTLITIILVLLVVLLVLAILGR